MAQEHDNTNRGALFENDRREKETHPHYKGSLDVAGVPHWISAWLAETKGGRRIVRLQVERKDAQDAPKQKTGMSAPFDPWDAPKADTAQAKANAAPSGAATADDTADNFDDVSF